MAKWARRMGIQSKDPNADELLKIDIAGDKAIEAALEKKLREVFPEYPDVGRQAGEQAEGILGAKNVPSDIRVTSIATYHRDDKKMVTGMRLHIPTNSFYKVDPVEKIRTFAKALGIERIDTGWGFPGQIDMNGMQISGERGSLQVMASTELLLKNLGIEQQAMTAMRDARIQKASELGCNCPG